MEVTLELAKSRLGELAPGRTRTPVTGDGDWRDAPAVKARLAGGYYLRAPAEGSCPYANICEHCPNFRTTPPRLQPVARRSPSPASPNGWASNAASSIGTVTYWPRYTPETQTPDEDSSVSVHLFRSFRTPPVGGISEAAQRPTFGSGYPLTLTSLAISSR